MTTIAWLFILAAIIIARQVAKGRVTNLSQDLSDAFLAITRGDSDALTAVFARTGDSNIPNADIPITGLVIAGAQGVIDKANPANAANASTPTNNVTILSTAYKLGTAAKGYRLTATGPDYYDCSGLVWRAVQKVGFKGIRFTTYTVKLSKGFTQLGSPGLGVSNVTLGDIVLWPNHHMGVVSGNDQFYSARSVKSGIGTSKISTFEPSFGKPIYLRYTG